MHYPNHMSGVTNSSFSVVGVEIGFHNSNCEVLGRTNLISTLWQPTLQLLSQLLVHENEGNWSKAVEGYDLLLRSSKAGSVGAATGESREWKYYKGLMRSLQQMGCSHVLGMYYLGLGQQKPAFLDHSEFKELQVSALWIVSSVWLMNCDCPL